jgi:PAS domain S-box-containing protein
MFDPKHLKFFYVNEGAVNQVGYSFKELHEMTPIDIAPAFTDETFKTMIKPLESGETSSLNFETIHRHKDGHDTHVEISLQLITPTRNSPRFIAMVRDISERRATENELKVYRIHLETLVNERTRKLEEARDELIRSERLATLGKLTATVSHELRNPLGAMRPSLHIIKNKKKGINDTHVQEAIERVDRNITRCDHIIDELLDFTRSSEPVIQHIILDDWIDLLLDEQIVSEKIILKRDLNARQSTIAFDPNRMRRAVINILENAFHATIAESENRSRDGLVVTLSTRTINNLIEITVTDTGAGIPDDVLPKIFEPLFSTKGFGVGLGMPIVKQIIEQHQGNISVNTQTGKGTSITLRFPVKTDKGAVA